MGHSYSNAGGQPHSRNITKGPPTGGGVGGGHRDWRGVDPMSPRLAQAGLGA
jgi:hypothetical protein